VPPSGVVAEVDDVVAGADEEFPQPRTPQRTSRPRPVLARDISITPGIGDARDLAPREK
jgi:hypothetical protein